MSSLAFASGMVLRARSRVVTLVQVKKALRDRFMVKKFGIDEEEIQAIDEHGRLKRPVAVAIFGALISWAIVAIIFVKAGAQGGGGEVGLIAFGVIACALTTTYAFLGWRYSRNAATRFAKIVGGAIVVGGLGLLFWALSRGP